MTTLLTKFWTDENGATSIEYALIASIVSIAILATLQQMAPMLVAKYEAINDGFNNN
ncbi:MAG: Flp family type IVb pilin [Hyphomicrobium sp.]|jgi:pilus assembly protein Flp/PilA|uniref:Flp family type IVb pilin n=1 Tax=Hyphomicrobium sp. TaxID=82 RepID=UPI0025C52BB4|nr:Flp family type IVb pilin [Hyphomicrobium sp.]MBX9864460.1 Flp family type IVb pilin [Hyphomicrobium sp.]